MDTTSGNKSAGHNEDNESEENVVLEEYRKHVADQAAQGIVPKPLDATQMAALVESLKNPLAGEEEVLLDLLINRVPLALMKPPT